MYFVYVDYKFHRKMYLKIQVIFTIRFRIQDISHKNVTWLLPNFEYL